MTVWGIGMRNIGRNKTRTGLTVLGGAVAVLAFILIRTVLWAWNVGVEYAAKDRLATRHKVSFILPLPKRYVETVQQIPGVTEVTWMNWFGGKAPNLPNEFFASMAVDPDTVIKVYPEMSLTAEEKDRWASDRRGAVVGDVLARKLGVKVGDKYTLTGTIYVGNWDFNIDGIYHATSKAIDRSQFMFHWDFLNESVPERRRDQIGWIATRIDNPARSAEISAAIDRAFDEKDVQTTTMSERAMQNGFMATLSAVLTALDVVSVIILLIMMLILGNTIAMGVRERTREYGVLRALGFSPRHLGTFVIGEGLITGILAGVFGVILAFPLIQVGGRWLEENVGAFFPYFRMDATIAVVSVVVTITLATAASLLPARQASKLSVVDALRRVG
jgi:putative ABC transport system permease protein